MNIAIAQWKSIFRTIADRIEQNKDYFSELDRELGDGDHGVTMSLGWRAIVQKLDEFAGDDCGALCKELAMSFLNAVGSSVGPLYATAFLRGGAALQGKAELTGDDLVRFWTAAVAGIGERGKAKVGEKTMMDMWIPAMEALQMAQQDGKETIAGFEAAVAAGERGMQSTAELVSQIGRSSRLGDRSVGHIDPGAASGYVILQSFTEALKSL